MSPKPLQNPAPAPEPAPRRPRGRPRKDGLPPGSYPKSTTATRTAGLHKVVSVAVRNTLERIAAEPEAANALRFMDRAVRLAWLCEQINDAHVDTKTVSLGALGGYDIVELPNNAPRFKAMEMLMRALGDFPSAAPLNASGPAQASIPAVVFVQHDNGRGPVPRELQRSSSAPAQLLADASRGGIVDMVEDVPSSTAPSESSVQYDADGYEVIT